MSVEHNFRERLEASHKWSDAPWWAEIYEQAFPGCLMQDMRKDGWWQRAGIDRRLHLPNATTVTVDEKVRERDYGDIALEVYSDLARKTDGWAVKEDLACDYFAYAVAPARRCHLLPRRELQRAFAVNRDDWSKVAHKWTPDCRDGYCSAVHIVDAPNDRGYVTRSVGVPIPLLDKALRESMVFTWSAEVAA